MLAQEIFDPDAAAALSASLQAIWDAFFAGVLTLIGGFFTALYGTIQNYLNGFITNGAVFFFVVIVIGVGYGMWRYG